MTDYREKARAFGKCSNNEAHDADCTCQQDAIAAAMKEVAEEAERVTADHFAKQEALFKSEREANAMLLKNVEYLMEANTKTQDRLKLYESATPDSPEVKEASSHVPCGEHFERIPGECQHCSIDVLVDALRAQQVRISVNEKEREAFAKTMLARLAEAEKISEGRRTALSEVSEERRMEWKRAEDAEAKLAAMTKENEKLRSNNARG